MFFSWFIWYMTIVVDCNNRLMYQCTIPSFFNANWCPSLFKNNPLPPKNKTKQNLKKNSKITTAKLRDRLALEKKSQIWSAEQLVMQGNFPHHCHQDHHQKIMIHNGTSMWSELSPVYCCHSAKCGLQKKPILWMAFLWLNP